MSVPSRPWGRIVQAFGCKAAPAAPTTSTIACLHHDCDYSYAHTHTQTHRHTCALILHLQLKPQKVEHPLGLAYCPSSPLLRALARCRGRWGRRISGRGLGMQGLEGSQVLVLPKGGVPEGKGTLGSMRRDPVLHVLPSSCS